MGKKKKKNKSHLPFRLNILFFVVFMLFSALILQLGVVQILHGQEAQEEIDRTENVTTKIPVPRGKMYDRYGNLVVDNKPLYSITYTPMKTTDAKDRLKIAQDLANLIEKDTSEVTKRDKQDYWILTAENPYAKLSKDEQKFTEDEEKAGEPSPYEILLDRIKPEDIDYTEDELQIIAIKRELDQAYALSPHIIKNQGVTTAEYARVAEHLTELPGVNVTTDWERQYPYENSYKSYIGAINSIPKNSLEYFLSRGYTRNDRVGTSGLEQMYETVLKGQKEHIQHTTNSDQELVNSKVVQEGERGKDLVLTVDMELQKRLDKIVQKELKAAIDKFPNKNQYMDDAYAVAMDPQTGEILAISGQKWDREDQKFIDTSYLAANGKYEPGSAVKAATLLAGYEEGVVRKGEPIYDSPIKLQGTDEKSSYRNLGEINDIEALKYSSNVYMFHIAMRIGGDPTYEHNEKLDFNPAQFQVMRNYYSQFGLGTETGARLPDNLTPSRDKGDDLLGGKMMDLAIGQYDTYTTLQLAQYISTIANDGYRMKPQFVKEIREPVAKRGKVGSVVESKEPKVMNKITMEDHYLQRVQKGLREVFLSGGTAHSYFKDVDYKVAGKTGTAQRYHYEPVKDKNGDIIRDEDGNVEDYKRVPVENLTLVGYAPYENPEIAFAVVVPDTGVITGGGYQYQTNKEIGRGLLDTYFELKKQRAEGKDVSDQSDESKESQNEDSE
ncbi:peptidoglycan D,D-transpeptidase FtsI family protein [Pontibacillus marinus]|uniref:serine-type D-Ala-D-Ala carboxypeptidase n=1 Tax=Pontibacillus marinus BH030004 = DSM 16465 TaxID=1385511 RepID=A0A0A5G2G2_9BACI|nr:penicillin-binding protein 2 [Pontibacillus marinus]KGX85338.1 penicillin-binding protein 2A [Pontibacillus marinus BH030004 = DSM 16465]